MIVHDAATAFVALIDAAIALVEALAAAGAFVVLVAAWTLAACVAPRARARREAQTGRGAPHSPSRDSRDAGTPPGPSDGRTAVRVPSWAHTQPLTYEIEEAA